MSITITVPNDDHVALRAMAKALEEIAVARGAPLQVNLVTQEMLEKLKETRSGNIVCEPEVDTTSDQFDSLGVSDGLLSQLVKTESANNERQSKGYVQTEEGQFNLSTGAQVDSTGTPWDERIHSASKALNADGTWRLRRKPKDMTDDDWTMYVNDVKVEIFESQRESGDDDIDPEHYAAETAEGINDIEPSVTPEGDDFHVDAGEVTEQEVAAIPAPPLPVPPAPPAQQSDMTFPDVMKFLTERHARITSEQVTEIITATGLKSIMDLNTQPEHTGPFIARVKALLGE